MSADQTPNPYPPGVEPEGKGWDMIRDFYEPNQILNIGEPAPATAKILDVLANLDAAAHKVDAAEDHLLRMQQTRDGLIIMARAAGVSASDLAARTGLNVSRIYQILAD